MDSVCAIDYPREKLEIQVLDDSTDETRAIAEAAVLRHSAEGVDIKYIHRTDRSWAIFLGGLVVVLPVAIALALGAHQEISTSSGDRKTSPIGQRDKNDQIYPKRFPRIC